ncbi:MAG: hypothetical protein A2X12_01320 [Bacteroidetes bacterium GWE2_29_8]|nr:MAG: hypothetical protein A2X12_01320 [Bacteroidetes bacterium GWE2_29_8]OFY21747.1 MAG: hypothetical protein A2X02_00265 [Bacteroidetes bacterium GWF2_29_10]
MPFDKGIKDGDEFTTKLIASGVSDKNKMNENVLFSNNDLLCNNNLKNVLILTKADNGNSLVYNIFLHYWLKMFGYSDFSARLFSLISFLLFLIIVYVFLINYSSKRIANISTFIIAVNPILIEYSNIARSYMFALMLITLASFLFYKILHDRSNSDKMIIFYYIVAISSVFSHYFTGFILFFHFVYFIIYERDKIIWKKFGVYFSIIIFAFIAWYIYIGKDAFDVLKSQNEYKATILTGNTELSWYEKTSLQSLINNLLRVYISITGINIYWDLLGCGIKFRYLLILIIIPLFFILSYVYELIKNKKNRVFNVFFIIMFLSSLFFNVSLAIISGFTGALTLRYFLFSLPYLIIIIAIAYEKLAKIKITNIIATFILIILVYCNFYDIIKNNSVIKNNEIEIIANKLRLYKEKELLIIHSNEYSAKLFNCYIYNHNTKVKQIYRNSYMMKNKIIFVNKNDTIVYKIKNPNNYWFLK